MKKMVDPNRLIATIVMIVRYLPIVVALNAHLVLEI